MSGTQHALTCTLPFPVIIEWVETNGVECVSSVGPRDAMPAFLYLYVDDVDRTYQRTLEAGAVSLEEPKDLPYGDRRGMVKDPFGNVWQIATQL